jgi:hypothetical protein
MSFFVSDGDGEKFCEAGILTWSIGCNVVAIGRVGGTLGYIYSVS